MLRRPVIDWLAVAKYCKDRLQREILHLRITCHVNIRCVSWWCKLPRLCPAHAVGNSTATATPLIASTQAERFSVSL